MVAQFADPGFDADASSAGAYARSTPKARGHKTKAHQAKGHNATTEAPLANFLPYVALVRDDVVLLKDGGLLVAVTYTPLQRDGISQDQRDQIACATETGMRDLDGRWAIWTRWSRRRSLRYPGGGFEVGSAAQLVDASWRGEFAPDYCFADRFTLYAVMYPSRGWEAFGDRVEAELGEGVPAAAAVWRSLVRNWSSTGVIRDLNDKLQAHLETLDRALSSALATMSELQPRRLRGDELRGHLQALVSPCEPDLGLPAPVHHQYLDGYLGSDQFDTTGDQLVVTGRAGLDERRHIAALTIKDWPEDTRPGMVDQLLFLPQEFDWVQSFVFKDRSVAMRSIVAMQRFFLNTRHSASAIAFQYFTKQESEIASSDKQRLANEAQAARDALESGNAVYGLYSGTLFVHGRSYAECTKAVKQADQALRNSQLQVIRETVGLLSAFLGALPGNRDRVVRRSLMTSGNLVDLMSLAAASSGPQQNDYYTEQLGGMVEAGAEHAGEAALPQPPLSLLHTAYGVPITFNFHVGHLSHTLFVGPSRGGKTVKALFLLSQACKYDPNIIILDKDKSSKIWTLTHGGRYINPAEDSDKASGLQMAPMTLLSDPGSRIWLTDFIASLMTSRQGDPGLSSREMKEIEKALAALEVFPSHLHTLTALCDQLPRELQERLERWCAGSALGAWFDNPEDSFELSRITTIELGQVLNDIELSGPTLHYLFRRIEKLAEKRERPTFIYVPEVWSASQNPLFARNLVNFLKTMAKLLGTVVMDTQSLEDAAQGDARFFTAVRENVPTLIFTPNPNAEAIRKFYVEQFGLSQSQVSQLSRGLQRRNYYIKQGSSFVAVDTLLPSFVHNVLRSDSRGLEVFERHYRSDIPLAQWSEGYLVEISGEQK